MTGTCSFSRRLLWKFLEPCCGRRLKTPQVYFIPNFILCEVPLGGRVWYALAEKWRFPRSVIFYDFFWRKVSTFMNLTFQVLIFKVIWKFVPTRVTDLIWIWCIPLLSFIRIQGKNWKLHSSGRASFFHF